MLRMLRRTHIAIVLLPIFLIGGIIGPALHSVHHAREFALIADEHDRVAEIVNHVHSEDGSDLIGPSIPALSDGVMCILCAPLVTTHIDVRLSITGEDFGSDYQLRSVTAEASFNFSSPLGRAPPTFS
jgi:hypothetical protein